VLRGRRGFSANGGEGSVNAAFDGTISVLYWASPVDWKRDREFLTGDPTAGAPAPCVSM
jgi:hypothetical protein